MKSNNKPRKKTERPHKKRRLRILLIIVIILVGIRFALPYIVLHVVNKKLAEIEGYRGHVNDIDLFLIGGSYKLNEIELKKIDGKIPVPFFAARRINLSLQWRALFQGKVVGEIIAYDPVLNYVNGPTEATSQLKIDKSWQDVVDELMPLKINSFRVVDGEIHYRDYSTKPEVDIYTTKVEIEADNLTNRKSDKLLLPSTVTGTAEAYGGHATLSMKLDALNKIPTFDANAEVKNINLPQMNDFLKAYGKFDVKKGDFSLFTEAAAKDGDLKGYAKPIVKDMHVDLTNNEGDISETIWEGLVGFGAWVFKNHVKDQLATQVDFEGKYTNPSVDVWTLIALTLRNAFIKALYASLNNSITITDVPEKNNDGFMHKLFNNDRKKSN